MPAPRLIPIAGALALAVACALAGCAASAPEGAATTTNGRSAQGMLPATDHGLRIRQWRIADDTDRIAEAMVRHADGEAADPPAIERLRRNGFRFVRIPAEDVDALLEDLGGAMVDIDGWHGQAYEWQEILARPLSESGRGVAVDGRVRRLARGRVRLMLRGWTIPMEDGPAMHVEMHPDHDRTRPTRFDQLLGRRSYRGERSPEATPAAEVGPDAPAPLTLGEVLLRTDGHPLPRRDLFVLIPRVPEALMPQAPPRTARRGGGP
jgi:hypothetical protein